MKLEQESYLGNRYEFKYILEPALAYRLQHYIEKVGLTLDDNSKHGPYIVNSLYFETPFLDDYYDKDASLLVRKKMRARMYSESWKGDLDAVWLEIKKKRNFQISKERMKITGENWKSFKISQSPLPLTRVSGNDEYNRFLNRFTYLFIKGRYKPHIIVKYRRMAYLGKFTSKIRITFDTDIKTCFANDAMQDDFMTPVHFGSTVMEVKFNDKLPWWFTKAVEMFDIHRFDFSKYTRSVVTLRNSYRIPVSR